MPSALDSVFDPGSTEPPIELTYDLRRVLAIPQRDADAVGAQIAEPLSKRFRRPLGQMTLRPLQALALAEAHDLKGLLSILPVGEGKTLISYLLPVLLRAQNPALLIPAGLDDKTRRDFEDLSRHWFGPIKYEIVSYELISRRPDLLEELQPDLIVADEADALKNPQAACTRRVRRYLLNRSRAGLAMIFCGLSGTIVNRSFKDYWHIQQWALPAEFQPLPYSYPVMQAWAAALDEKIESPRPLGELARFVGKENATVPEVRSEFGRRLRATPGIVGSAEGSKVSASLRIRQTEKRIPIIEKALTEMRRTWETPGGVEFSEAADLWRHAREIANGFYYVWDPLPPKWWLEPRREFHAFVRNVLSGSRTLDTMAQVADRFANENVIRNWLEVKKEYVPNVKPQWFTDDVLEYASQWALENGGLVWVEHKAVGERLESIYKVPYFREQGRNDLGLSIVNYGGGFAAVSSIACRRGFNLQRYSKNLILNAQPDGRYYEQIIGRKQRFGQTADFVDVEVLITAAEQREGFEQAIRDAEYIQQTTGQRQKLCYGDYV